MKLQNLVNSS